MQMLIKTMKNKSSVTLIFMGLLLLIFGNQSATASSLDIANLAIFRQYSGVDLINGNAYCGLNPSSIRERLGKSEQDYRIWSLSDQHNLSIELKLTNSKRNFDGTPVGPGLDSFSIVIGNYTLVLTGQSGYPAYVHLIQLFDNSCGVNCSKELVHCEVKQSYPK